MRVVCCVFHFYDILEQQIREDRKTPDVDGGQWGVWGDTCSVALLRESHGHQFVGSVRMQHRRVDLLSVHHTSVVLTLTESAPT